MINTSFRFSAMKGPGLGLEEQPAGSAAVMVGDLLCGDGSSGTGTAPAAIYVFAPDWSPPPG